MAVEGRSQAPLCPAPQSQAGLASVAEGGRRPQHWGKFVRCCYNRDLTRACRGGPEPSPYLLLAMGKSGLRSSGLGELQAWASRDPAEGKALLPPLVHLSIRLPGEWPGLREPPGVPVRRFCRQGLEWFCRQGRFGVLRLPGRGVGVGVRVGRGG